MSCCTNTYDLFCGDSCEMMTLPFEYTQTGTYRFLFETQFKWEVKQAGISGNPIILDLSKFPENYDLEIKVFNPDGTRFTFMESSFEYDCFRIRVNIL